jgi:hypothetical protein
MDNINYRGIPTSLFLNGPELEIVTDPQSVSDVVGVATFTGIATATGQLDGGSVAFQWYYDNSLVNNSSNIDIVNFDDATGTGSSITISGITTANDDGKSVYFVADYIPSAYFEAGIAKSTANAFNEPLTSSSALIEVFPQIDINNQPIPITVGTENSVTFSIGASILPNSYSLSYQWQLDDQDLPDSGNFTSGGNTFVVSGGLGDTLTISSAEITTAVIRCKLTPVGRSLPEVISDQVTLTTTSPRNILGIEQYNYTDATATLSKFDLSDESVSLSLSFDSHPGNAICLYADEQDIDVEMDMYGGIGVQQSGLPGEGGFSKIRFTMKKDEEYIITGLFDAVNAPSLYRKGTLIAVVGSGGASGGGQKGGNGGGINVAGQDGEGATGGSGGPLIESGTLPSDGIFGDRTSLTPVTPDTKRTGLVNGEYLGGRTLPCARGVYWRDQGKSPCEDLGTIKFRTPDGTEISNTAEIDRGYKSGYNIIQTSSGSLGTQTVNSGSGATGGAAGQNGLAGGGGSGYTDGSVSVIQTQLGGSTGDSLVVIRLEPAPVPVPTPTPAPTPTPPPAPTTGDFAHFYIPSSRSSHFTVTGIISSISATGSPGGNLQWADRSRAHYIITFNRDVINSPLGFGLLSCLTGAGGQSDCGIGMKFLERVSSNQIRVWFVRGNNTSSTFVRNVRITRS